MTKFKDWFDKKLVQGAFPYKVNTHFEPVYDVVINVSDEWYPEIEAQLREKYIRHYWFPMNECKKDIGLNSIYGAMCILHHVELKNLSVYLNCHAGVNRSEIVKCAYYFMRTGTQLETEQNGFINRLVAACSRGYLPPRAEMEAFLTGCNNRFKYDTIGGLLDGLKLNNLNNF